MPDNTNELAATPAVTESDRVIDLDKLEPETAPAGEDASPPVKTDDVKKDAEQEPGEGEEKADNKKPSGAQRAKAREQRLLNEIAQRDRELADLRAKTDLPAEKAGDVEKEPKEEDYNGDWFAYQRALTAFEARKEARDIARKELQARDESQRNERAATERRAHVMAHAERVETAREAISDYDKIVSGATDIMISPAVGEEIMTSEKSALIAYHLAQHPDEVEALNQMTPRELARAMGRLEATVKLPEPKKQTSAPPPMTAVKGGAAPASADNDLEAWLTKTYGKRA